MFSIPEQFSAVAQFPQFPQIPQIPQIPQLQSQLQSQLDFINTFASQAVESTSKVIALNLNTAKASVEKSQATAQKLFGVKDAQEFFSLASAPAGSLDSVLEYGRQLYNIASTAQAELMKAAGEHAKDTPAAAVLKLAGPAKAAKQIVVTEAEATPAPKAAKSKAKAVEAEAAAEEVEESGKQSSFPTVASVDEDSKPAKVKAKPVH